MPKVIYSDAINTKGDTMRLLVPVFMLSVAAAISGLGATTALGAPAEPEPAPPPGYQSNPQAAGAVIGGILGQKIARRMDEGDRRMAADAEYQALEFGQPGSSTAWKNPITQHHGVIVPEKPYPQGDEYCRGFTHNVELGDAGDTIREIACRKPDGTWIAGL
jgi:surface antigen